jgi:hypothetical protein
VLLKNGFFIFGPRIKNKRTMKKNKMIGLVIWLITLIVPFNIGFLLEMGPNLITLITFILTIVGGGFGAYFFSKSSGQSA